jgi:hypothetical protein
MSSLIGTTIHFTIRDSGFLPIVKDISTDSVAIKYSFPSVKYILIGLSNILVLILNCFIKSGEIQFP